MALITLCQKLVYALQNSSDAAPGPDGFQVSFLRHAPVHYHEELLHIYNTIWQRGDFPQEWETAAILPLLKPGKNPSEMSGYRPISLTSTLGKLYEKMVDRRLQWELERTNLLSPSQCGFHLARSAIDQVLYCQSFIHDGFLHKQHTLAIFLGISKAF